MTVPVASFTVDGLMSYNHCVAGVPISFVDTSTNVPTSWLWNFGDGTTSTEQNPTHTYPHVFGQQSHSYSVTMVATNVDGSNTAWRWAPDFNGVAVLDFIYTIDPSTISGINVNFDGPSAGVGGTYSWDFGDGNTSTVNDPTHIYSVAGTYTITEVVTVIAPSSYTLTITQVIDVVPKVSTASFDVKLVWDTGAADFTAVILSPTITDNGNTRTSVLWDFGDGTTSTSTSPGNHTFPDDTPRDVTLTVTYSNPGVPPTVVTHSVTPRAFRIQFSWEITGLHVDFTNETNIGYGVYEYGGDYLDHYDWDFGDGTGLTQTIAEAIAAGVIGHDYSTYGSKTVRLTVSTTKYG